MSVTDNKKIKRKMHFCIDKSAFFCYNRMYPINNLFKKETP